jgi:hypothetical protein
MKLTTEGIYNLINTVESEIASTLNGDVEAFHSVDVKNNSIILKLYVMEDRYYDIYVSYEFIFRPNNGYVTLYTTYSFSPIDPDEHTDEIYTIEETIAFLKTLIEEAE